MWRSNRRVLRLEALEERWVPTLLGQQVFPADHPWNQQITQAPVAANSQAIIDHIIQQYGNNRLHPDFGERYGDGRELYGIPINIVRGNSTPKVSVVIDAYPGESDIVPAPIPASVVLEGDYQNGPRVGVNNRGDSHLILYDVDNNLAYEFYRMSRPSENADGRWHADQQTVWDLKSNSFRTLGWTSADAAGLSILAGLVRPDEALPVSQGGQGVIRHAIRFTLRNNIILDQFVYPASHTANPGNNNPSVQPPMGARFRLKASVDISQMNPQARIVAQAMKDYGMILADNGSNFYFSGASYSVDASNQITLTWDDDDIQSTTRGLKSLRFSDFEVVDLTPMVTDLSVHSGTAGTTVTVYGKNFSGAAGRLQVLFGSQPASTVTLLDDGRLTAVVPAGSGTVEVRVQSGVTTAPNPDNVRNTIFGYGISAVNANTRFTYGGSTGTQPTITSASAATFLEGQAVSFLVATTGSPVPTITWSGTLPPGVSLTDQGNGTARLSGTPTVGSVGVYVLTLTASNGVGQNANQTFRLSIQQRVAEAVTVVGSDEGVVARVAIYPNGGGRITRTPYGTKFKGGVRVASGDVNGDGFTDVIVAPGSGATPAVKIYSGRDYSLLRSFYAFDPSYRGGLFVAAGDVLGLGASQVVVAAASGARPYVRIYDVRSGIVLSRSVLAFSSSYTSGVTVAAADGVLVAGMAVQGSTVKVFDQANLSRIRTLQPFGSFMGGITVSVGGGHLAVGRATGSAQVKSYQLQDFGLERAWSTSATRPARGYSGGVRVAWSQTSSGDWELVTGTGPGWNSLIQFWVAGTWQKREERVEFGGGLGGIWVA